MEETKNKNEQRKLIWLFSRSKESMSLFCIYKQNQHDNKSIRKVNFFSVLNVRIDKEKVGDGCSRSENTRKKWSEIVKVKENMLIYQGHIFVFPWFKLIFFWIKENNFLFTSYVLLLWKRPKNK